MSNKSDNKYDVIIVGGSYAGLSAAMALGRSLKKVLIIDGGESCNKQTPHSHNFLTHDGAKPAAIAQIAKEQVLKYSTVEFINGCAIKGGKTESGFLVTLQSGEEFEAKKLIFASGIKDIMPDIRGLSDCWGISVIHCPYCHGYEFKGRKTAIMANGDHAYHIASLVNNLTNNLTIVTNGNSKFSDEQLSKLQNHNIEVIQTEITEVKHQGGHLQSVVFSDGKTLELNALYAALPFVQSSDIPISLGCKLTEMGYIQVDDFKKTTVNGVYACGDNSTMMRSVANAVATGNIAGAVANMELTQEFF